MSGTNIRINAGVYFSVLWWSTKNELFCVRVRVARVDVQVRLQHLFHSIGYVIC